MRKFGSDRLKTWAERLGMQEGEVIEHRFVSKALESAQRRVEAHHFDIRKHLLKYDNVMGKQREVIYEMRRDLLAGEDPRGELLRMAEANIENLVKTYAPAKTYAEEWNSNAILDSLAAVFGIQPDLSAVINQNATKTESDSIRGKLEEFLVAAVQERFEQRIHEIGAEQYAEIIRMLMLRTIDSRWKEHLYTMDHLRDSVGLRGYAQKDPLVEYEKEGYDLFEQMFEGIERDVVTMAFKIQVTPEGQRRAPVIRGIRRQPAARSRQQQGAPDKPAEPVLTRRSNKVGRNDPCPCGSGKKYKKCCGA